MKMSKTTELQKAVQEMKDDIRTNQGKTDANQAESTARLEARIDANNKNIEVLRSTRLLNGYPPS
jgi:hypothetical protein